ncbi:hypothetical protein IRJ41_002619 [Triplophysa rosa]|uniref:Uncharacterized protein n=1 Tax=Triplophysa rosa TaxID=992332 RepID=A0A9W7TVA4_TRIRA|nr:hypothetical protein IRJ41_002619 [Triplophysa rosa]
MDKMKRTIERLSQSSCAADPQLPAQRWCEAEPWGLRMEWLTISTLLEAGGTKPALRRDEKGWKEAWVKTKDDKGKRREERKARPRRIKKKKKKRLGAGTRQAYQKLGKVLEEGQTNYACERNSIGNPKPGEGRLAGARSLVNNEVLLEDKANFKLRMLTSSRKRCVFSQINVLDERQTAMQTDRQLLTVRRKSLQQSHDKVFGYVWRETYYCPFDNNIRSLQCLVIGPIPLVSSLSFPKCLITHTCPVSLSLVCLPFKYPHVSLSCARGLYYVPAMCLLCACYVPAMCLLCACYVPAMCLLCAFQRKLRQSDCHEIQFLCGGGKDLWETIKESALFPGHETVWKGKLILALSTPRRPPLIHFQMFPVLSLTSAYSRAEMHQREVYIV